LKLDPQARAVIERLAASGAPPLHGLAPDEARRAYRASRAALAAAPAYVEEIRELSIPGLAGPLRARLYHPGGTGSAPPGMVYFHGGGFIYGDLDTHDVVCRGIAQGTPCAVVSVDYRLAPEHRFPAAVEDAFAATAWIAANGAALRLDPARLVVAGDSAGGNRRGRGLMARDAGGPALSMQVLVYPTTDFAEEAESVASFAEGYLLTRESVRWVKRSYLRDERDAFDWRASPLRAGDFSRLPAAYIITAGFDPLRDEGRAYAELLAEAGTAVTHECLEGQVHGFLMMGADIAAAGHAIQRIGQICACISGPCLARAADGVGIPSGSSFGETRLKPVESCVQPAA
jgi:acetyl esterase